MTAANFEKSLKRVLVYEGGYSNHPSDPGGPTMKGVIQRVYDGYRKRKGLPTRSVQYLAENELHEIYRTQYWDLVRGDELPPGVDFVVFDGAVNSGPSQSVKWLQRALGVKADGNIGEATLAAASTANRTALINGICDRRLAFLKALRTWPVFGKGWGSRVADVRRWGLSFGKVSTPEPIPQPKPEGPMSKAELPTQQEKPAVESKTIWASIGGILSAVAAFATDWRVLTVLVVAFFLFIAAERYLRWDIKGWFRS